MRIIAVEDEPLFASNLEMIIDELGYELVGITDNSEEMMRFFLSLKPDLAIIDINIKGTMNGIEVAQKMSVSQNPIPIVFVTSYSEQETFEEAKKTNPYAYIVKPFENQDLQRTIELAFHRYNQPNSTETGQVWNNEALVRNSFFVKVGDMLQKVGVKDILIIEIMDKHCQITTQTHSFFVRISLKELIKKLPPTDFIQIHRSIVVNANSIESINAKENTLKVMNRYLDISKNYKENLLSRLNLL